MLSWHIHFASNNKMHFSLCLRCPIFLSDINQILVFLTDFHKVPSVKYKRNPFSGSCSTIGGKMDDKA